MYDITASIVAYDSKPDILCKAVESFLGSDLDTKLYVIDNSPSDRLKSICNDKRIFYIHNSANIGFGPAHNIAIDRSMNDSSYHLVLNPDTAFEKNVLENLYNFMENSTDVGLVMPKICNLDNSLQYLCKVLPNPLNFVLRRLAFGPLHKAFKDRLENYELRFTGYDKIMDVPYLSGCFMFIRAEAFKKAGLFDERFFLHFEDLDLSRRINKYYRTIYYPRVSIYHGERNNGKESLKILSHLFSSYIKYFNKWGWFFDKERREVNKNILEKLKALR